MDNLCHFDDIEKLERANLYRILELTSSYGNFKYYKPTCNGSLREYKYYEKKITDVWVLLSLRYLWQIQIQTESVRIHVATDHCDHNIKYIQDINEHLRPPSIHRSTDTFAVCISTPSQDIYIQELHMSRLSTAWAQNFIHVSCPCAPFNVGIFWWHCLITNDTNIIYACVCTI